MSGFVIRWTLEYLPGLMYKWLSEGNIGGLSRTESGLQRI